MLADRTATWNNWISWSPESKEYLKTEVGAIAWSLVISSIYLETFLVFPPSKYSCREYRRCRRCSAVASVDCSTLFLRDMRHTWPICDITVCLSTYINLVFFLELLSSPALLCTAGNLAFPRCITRHILRHSIFKNGYSNLTDREKYKHRDPPWKRSCTITEPVL
jgi:hypothetical protein